MNIFEQEHKENDFAVTIERSVLVAEAAVGKGNRFFLKACTHFPVDHLSQSFRRGQVQI